MRGFPSSPPMNETCALLCRSHTGSTFYWPLISHLALPILQNLEVDVIVPVKRTKNGPSTYRRRTKNHLRITYQPLQHLIKKLAYLLQLHVTQVLLYPLFYRVPSFQAHQAKFPVKISWQIHKEQN